MNHSPQRDSSTNSVSRLIFELSKLPGIGEKTATRLAYYILKQGPEFSSSLAAAIQSAKQATRLCGECFTFTDQERCSFCKDHNRNPHLICVVEKPSDVTAIDQTGAFRGRYHVLHGVLSPLDGVGPDEIKIRELLLRLQNTIIQADLTSCEVVLATNPSVEGEATALYLTRLLKPLGVKVSRLASGLPVGGMLEYTDRQTIGKALENRMEMN